MMIAGGIIGGKPSITFQAMRQIQAANQGSYTFTDVPFGKPLPKRYLIIGAAVVDGVPNAMTVSGVAATRHVTVQEDSDTAQIWGVPLPSGEAGTIILSNPSSSMDFGAIYVWSAYNLRSTTPTDTASSTFLLSGVSDISVNVLGGGMVVALAMLALQLGTTIVFTGVETDSQTPSPPVVHAGGHAAGLPAATPHAVTAARATGFGAVSVAASFR